MWACPQLLSQIPDTERYKNSMVRVVRYAMVNLLQPIEISWFRGVCNGSYPLFKTISAELGLKPNWFG